MKFAVFSANAALLSIAFSAQAVGGELSTPAAYTWSGYYLGLTGGIARSANDVSLRLEDGATPHYGTGAAPTEALGSQDFSKHGSIVGLKTGLNWQSGAWVFGIEADLSWFGNGEATKSIEGAPFSSPFPGRFAAFDYTAETDWVSTLRPRLGYASGRWLIYGTGGLAVGRVSFSNDYLDFAPLGGGNGRASSAVTRTQTGWTLGGGLELAVSENWLLSAEYLHIDLGSVSATGSVSSLNSATATQVHKTSVTHDLVRAGLSFKF